MPRRPLICSVPIMSTATKDYPSGGLRVSDADRDRAIAELSEHFQAGRLSAEELEAFRTGRALQTRTAGELAQLFTDLPRQQAAMTGTAATPARAGSFRPALIPAARSPSSPLCWPASLAGSPRPDGAGPGISHRQAPGVRPGRQAPR